MGGALSEFPPIISLLWLFAFLMFVSFKIGEYRLERENSRLVLAHEAEIAEMKRLFAEEILSLEESESHLLAQLRELTLPKQGSLF